MALDPRVTASPRADAKLSTLSELDGSIRLGWVAPDVLWARFQGRLSVGLASAARLRREAALGGALRCGEDCDRRAARSQRRPGQKRPSMTRRVFLSE